MTEPVTINEIKYPADLAGDAKELHELTHAYLSCLMENGVPGEMHTDLLGAFYAKLPQRFKRVMAFQIARRERMAWEAEHADSASPCIECGKDVFGCMTLKELGDQDDSGIRCCDRCTH